MRHHERGATALAPACLVLLAASVLGAAVAEIVRTELVVARSRRIFVDGLAAADACLARVAATLPAGWDHAVALAGADGIVGTADDGLLAAPSGCTALLRPGPLGASRPYLDVTAMVPGGARGVRAVVGAATPPVPAIVWAEGASLGTVTGRLLLDGIDDSRPDVAALPAVATPDDPASVDAWLAGMPAALVLAGTPAPEYAPAPPLDSMAARLLAAGALPSFAPSSPASVPGLYAIAGDLAVTTSGSGAGLLYVDGRLDIEADFTFSGIVAARRGLRVGGGVVARIAGATWLGLPAFDVAGEARVEHDRAALDAAAALFAFPRRAAVAGLVDR